MVTERDDDFPGRENDDATDPGEELAPILERAKRVYNVPPETPRDEMWAAIKDTMAGRKAAAEEISGDAVEVVPVIPLAAARARRQLALRRAAGWAVAAAAVLVVGIGIGRVSAPGARAGAGVAEAPNPTAMRLAAEEHLGRTESLLTLVKLDAREGKVDPQVGPWARSLLAQTRLLLDAPDDKDPAMKQLLEDLELVLVQIVGVADAGPQATGRTRTELNLAVKGLEDRDVLPRIQALVPMGSGMSGT